jgi:ribonucleoside-diphosphate reductase alpha chain
VGIVVPDIVMELAARGEDYYQFSPYDVERLYGKPLSDINVTEMYQTLVQDGRVRKKKTSARGLFTRIAELNAESGYPYVLFEDNANRLNPVHGKIVMSNLCSEILQVSEASTYNEDLSYAHVGRDISCNLASTNVARLIASGEQEAYYRASVRALSNVAVDSNVKSVPSIERGNQGGRAIGLGHMNLHGFFMSKGVAYASETARLFARTYFAASNFYTLKASMELARETGSPFFEFEKSKYADGSYFDKYVTRSWLPETPEVEALFNGAQLPTVEDWQALMADVMKYGVYNSYRQAIAPNGSIAYINDATSCIHPAPSRIERRPEGKLGERYYPAPFLTDENEAQYFDAYEIGPKAVIDIYAEANEHIDQGMSLTIFMPASATTRDINKVQNYAWKKGLRTIYYVRLAEKELAGTECESCKA